MSGQTAKAVIWTWILAEIATGDIVWAYWRGLTGG